jgi:hypothetical protein
MECNVCKKIFGTKNTLEHHKKTAKYCLELQGKKDTNYECSYCKKYLSTNERLNTHIISCRERKRLENKENEQKIQKNLDDQKKYYQDKLEEKDKQTKQKLEEKDKQILELKSKLEKFENVVIAAASEPKTKTTTNVVVNKDENKTEIPIPLHEQMSSIVIEEIKDDDDKEHYSNISLNNIVITSRPIDHYVNATQLCQAGGKLFKDWFRLESTKELINELSTDGRIPPSALVESKRGGNDKSKQGSWIHPDLSIQLAQWISPKFAIQVSKWVRTLFNQGSIEIDLNLLREKERDMRIKDHRIKQLESVCLSKQRRVEYPEHNVIYMLTTDDHLQRRTYIIGKAKNLTNRLSTYNKTCDHTVVHYRECKSEEDMETAETMILSKLRDYREQANRDRFILPDDKDASYFTHTINECVLFLSKNI